MNALRNKVQLIGWLGQDPDIRTLDSGKKVAHFNLATRETYKNADGNKIEESVWHNIVAWNGLAEISSKFLRKGREVCIEGRISYRTFTDKNGNQRNVTDIIATDMVMLSQRPGERNLTGDEVPAFESQGGAETDDPSFQEKTPSGSGKAKSKE